jgi:phenylpropionate dioxygenase-like ring-hydroxylating dioxygenase large terminal subunit
MPATATTRLIEHLNTPHRPGTFYQRVLDTDTHPVPERIQESHPLESGPTSVDVAQYLTREQHDREVARLWMKTWQMACRQDQIPEVGDSLVYDIAHMSYVIVRMTPTVIKAYVNSCLHRGRQLVDSDPCAARLKQLRCAFHGFTWDLDGSLAGIPGAWDFPHVNFEDWQLPEAHVATWGGFVFINPNPGAEPFEDFARGLDRFFAPYQYAERYTAAHVVKVIDCNWKVAQEAFMENLHIIATHPQLLAQSSNLDVRYDAWDNFSRASSPNFLPSAFLTWFPSEQDIMDATLDRRLDADPVMQVPEGRTAREVGAEQARASLARIIGHSAAEELCDAELVDSFYFTLFPNLHPWSSYNRICFRFRPYGDDPGRCIQDVYLLDPYSGERPAASPTHVLAQHDDFTAGTEIGPYLARILNQDLYNLPRIQQGLRASQRKSVVFADYQESKIRHFYRLLNEYLEQALWPLA